MARKKPDTKETIFTFECDWCHLEEPIVRRPNTTHVRPEGWQYVWHGGMKVQCICTRCVEAFNEAIVIARAKRIEQRTP